MKKVMSLILAGIILLCYLTGCQLAQESKTEQMTQKSENEERVMAIGGYITKEPLKQSGRIYAEEVTETSEDGEPEVWHLFRNQNGYGGYVYYIKNKGFITETSDGDWEYFFEDRSNKNVGDGWETDTSEMACKVNYDYLANSDGVIFVNPVYEDKDGKVYMEPADCGIDVNKESSGESYISESFEAEDMIEKDGEKQKLITKAIVHVGVDKSTEKLKIAVYNQQDEVVEQKEIDVEKAPEKLKVSKDAEYIIVNYFIKGKISDTKLISLKSEDGEEDYFTIEYCYGDKSSLLLKNKIIEIEK